MKKIYLFLFAILCSFVLRAQTVNCATLPVLTVGTPVTTGNLAAPGGVYDFGTCGYLTPGQERVYSFTSGAAGTYSLNVTSVNAGNGFIDYFYKAADGACSAATGYQCISDVIVPGFYSTTLAAFTTYYVFADAEDASGVVANHTFQIDFTPPPVNDGAPGAITLTLGAGCAGAPYTNLGATAGAGEPFPSCSGAIYSPVWFKFVAPASGAVRVSTDFAGGTFDDSKVAIFSASNVNDYSTFNIISCDDDGGTAAGSEFMSTVFATGLTAGITYYVAVDKFSAGTSSGAFCIAVDALDQTMLATINNCASGYQNPIGTTTPYTGWFNMLDGSGKLVALIRKSTGTDPGLFSAEQNVNTAAIRQTGGVFYLNRNFHIASTETNTEVRFFFLNTELAALTAADPGATLSTLGGAKQTGAACENNFATANGAYSYFNQTGNGSASGVSWITTNVPSFSNFYLFRAGAVVPVTVEFFRGSKIAGANYLDWKVNCINEPSVTLILERSSDGRNFKAINSQTETAARCLQGFNYTDATPLAGMNYYRLKTITPGGDFRYSLIVALLNKDKGFELVSIAPSPVKALAVLSVTTVKGGKMTIAVSDMTGKVVMTQSVTVIAGNNPVNMNFSTLGAGTYNITVVNAENEMKTTRFVKY